MEVRGRLVTLLLLWTISGASPALEVPYLSGRVNDQVALIGDESRARIEQRLQKLEQQSGAQVAVLIIRGLQGESLEDFSMQVAETWKLGREGVDDGVLLLIAREDRGIRIEVGYGLEHVLTDLESRRIIDYLMAPAFRKGEFEQGVEAAVEAIAAKIAGEEMLIPDDVSAGPPAGAWIFLGFVGLLMAQFAAFAVALKGSGGWALYLFLAPFFYLVPSMFGHTAALVSLGSWLLLVPVLRYFWPQGWKIESTGASTGGGGSSGGGYSGGGGFSGGGGSFGGGGASGRW